MTQVNAAVFLLPFACFFLPSDSKLEEIVTEDAHMITTADIICDIDPSKTLIYSASAPPSM